MKLNLGISVSYMYISLLFYYIMLPTLPGIWPYHRLCCWHFVLFSCVTLVFVSSVSLTFICFIVVSMYPNEFLTRKCLLIWELCLGHQYDGFIVQNMLIIKPQNEYKEELISVISSSYSIVFNITI